MQRLAVLICATLTLAWASPALASPCDDPQPAWLMCEDFEQGGLGWQQWFDQSAFVECDGCPDGVNDPDRIQLLADPAAAHDGDWSLHLPAAAAANYRGASLAYRTCNGSGEQGCLLTGHDELYFRSWVRLADDHQYVHHFLSIAGTQPDEYWGADGNAGCRPNGYRAAGTTLDFNTDHELFFYTYFPEMNCDMGGYCDGVYAQGICDGCAQKDMPCENGLECCWGNLFAPDPPKVLATGEWTCLELHMQINTPGQADGAMSFWVDDELSLEQTGMHWRDVEELALNKAWLQHYIAGGDADQPNEVWFDDVVVSTERIGCMATGDGDGDPGDGDGDPGDGDGDGDPGDGDGDGDSGSGDGDAGEATGTSESADGPGADDPAGCSCNTANPSPMRLWWSCLILLGLGAAPRSTRRLRSGTPL
ncbi:Chitinase [Enhygromyxa salina]|uniref:Chitinase n=1 Tax=Enhygromyxa salina TaxID=215803 RepID=A0A0C2D081_9BACT|nr:dickkopf-related protein [Enhygromyxa salina]KIG16641.1 Chitinase [Enhygromyxa salina]